MSSVQLGRLQHMTGNAWFHMGCVNSLLDESHMGDPPLNANPALLEMLHYMSSDKLGLYHSRTIVLTSSP